MGKGGGGCCCCVPMCPYYQRKCPPNTEWFSFPREEKYKKIWLVKIRREIGEKFQLTKCTRICSHHFLPSDKFPRNSLGKIPRLKKTAVPSIFPWTTQNITAVERDSRLAKRNSSKLLVPEVAASPLTSQVTNIIACQVNNDEVDWNLEKSKLLAQIEELKARNENLSCENETLQAQMKKCEEENISLKNENSSLKCKVLKMEKQNLHYENIRDYDKLVKFYNGFTNGK